MIYHFYGFERYRYTIVRCRDGGRNFKIGRRYVIGHSPGEADGHFPRRGGGGGSCLNFFLIFCSREPMDSNQK